MSYIVKITNLFDDLKSNNDLKSGHGLSFYIKTADKRYLFDTGNGTDFINNANQLGISIKDVDALFISHNHYDHIGGLEFFIEINKKAKIYIKKDAIYNTYTYSRGYPEPMGKYYEELSHSDRVVLVDDFIKVDDFYLVTDTVGKEEYFAKGSQYYMDKNGAETPDVFTHEMFLVYVNDGKANIISACSHRGIRNIIETATQKFNLPINMIIAGMHLMLYAGKSINCTEEYYFSLVDYLLEQEFSKLYTCHCTGKFAYDLLKRDLKEKIDYFGLGETIEI
ncbi:MAG: MBL fold metallo-hydrolase [Clostridia bacterium]|nr:MBL fold metallo-hydrolase [Clostridia bacterium]